MMYFIEPFELMISAGTIQLVVFRSRFCWSAKFAEDNGDETITVFVLVRLGAKARAGRRVNFEGKTEFKQKTNPGREEYRS